MKEKPTVNALDRSFVGHPKPLFSLSMTELWERFSFYGIRPLLVLFMAAAIFEGGLGIAREQAAAIVGIFGGCLYLATLPGGWLADNLLGQKKAVLYGAIIIALGHLCIALSLFTQAMFFLGLCFIVIGTGLFKTCSSVMVGMLYKDEDPRRDSGFTIFYMGINLGAFVAPLLCGTVQKEFGWHLGFGIGGLGMLLAVLIFYFKTIKDFKEFEQGLSAKVDAPLKINKFALPLIYIFLAIFVVLFLLFYFKLIIIDPVSFSKNMILIIVLATGIYFCYLYFFCNLNASEKKSLFLLVLLYLAAALFWSAFEQKPTSFNLFAQDFTDRIFFGYEIPAAFSQSLNPLFIIAFAPLMSMLWIYLAKRNCEFSSLTKFILGIIGAGIGFVIMIFAANAVLKTGQTVSAWWLVSSIWFLTMGELCLSPVGLSIMSKLAPSIIRNQIMGLWFVSSALGNFIAGLIGGGVRADNIEHLPELFMQCALVLFATAIVLFVIAKIMSKFLALKG
ncbi:peptide MFS transporter [Campylobacter troglodytis]|uniref:peptide MFS transporter n=1 Tax=Campylobacter troglodytis TaxID=654363 RepID=UPI001159308C|nr:peptide MFS transporter [Campylobacter troglodytis]TQR60221.1 MFS transporter [Campylobacter troglodytis]